MTESRRRPHPVEPNADGNGRARPSAGNRQNGDRPPSERNGARRRRLKAAQAIRLATSQLSELTGRPVDGVSQLARSDDGWAMTLEVVELERVPHSTDVLGRYEVVVDDEGDLVEYRRTTRYVRSQPGED